MTRKPHHPRRYAAAEGNPPVIGSAAAVAAGGAADDPRPRRHRVRAARADADRASARRWSACSSRRSRRAGTATAQVHLVLALGLAGRRVRPAIVVAAAQPVRQGQPHHVAAMGAVASTGRRCSSRARSSCSRFVACCSSPTPAEQPVHRAGVGRAGQPGGAREPGRRAHADRGLPADAVRGRRHAALPGGQRPADHVRRARGPVAAAVPPVRAGPPAPAALAGGRGQVLPARRVLLGVLPVRHRAAVRLRRLGAALRHRRGRGQQHGQRDRCCSPASRCWSSACCSRSAPCRSRRGRRTSTRARRRRSPRSWPSCTKVAAFGAHPAGASTSALGRPALGLAADDVGRRRSSRCSSAPCSPSPRPTSSGCSPTPRSRTPASC